MDTFANVMRQHARATPDAPALTAGGVTRSFAALHAASSRAANVLLARGAGPGERVAILSRNRAEHLVALLACSKIGAIATGLNWRLAPGELAEIVARAAPAVVLAGDEEMPLLGGAPALCFDREWPALCDAAPACDPGHMGGPDEIALLLYTSGTTGLPKGVALSNRNMSFTRRLATESWGMGPASVNLVAMPMFHIGGCGYGSSAFMAGGHTVLMRDADPASVVAAIERHRVTHAFFVPTVVQSLLRAPGIGRADLSSLELLMYGAAPMGDVLLRQAMARLGCRFMHAYGMTEAAGTVVVMPPEDHDPEARPDLLRSCGRALPWVELRIVDPATGREAAAGTPGEIRLRSEMITPGYWRDEAATAEAITPDGWFRTGDAAWRDEGGNVYLFDRYKDMIITGGENVYPAEIENVLNAHPGVREVGVIGVPHDKWGETPLAVIVPRPGARIDEAEVIAFCRARLARYKCPTAVRVADALPRNASGKLLKHEMRRAFAAGGRVDA
jgi:long-chain acyl-CoA synthetase